MGETIRLGTIRQLALRVHDVQRAIEYYRDALGMNLLFQVPNMAFFDCGGIRLMLTLPENKEFDTPGSVIYFQTDDIQAACKVLSQQGVVFQDKPEMVADMGDHELWVSFFRDPFDNQLALMSEVYK